MTLKVGALAPHTSGWGHFWRSAPEANGAHRVAVLVGSVQVDTAAHALKRPRARVTLRL
jgi:hypothetical protein